MDHVRILKQAWQITWRYRALWVFGVILALTTARSGTGGPQFNSLGEDISSPSGEFWIPEISSEMVGALIAVIVGLLCLMLILMVVASIARYVAETALIRMVNDHAETGEQQRVRQGFRLGWSRAAWRLFLIDMLVNVPAILVLILLFAIAFAPLLLWTTDSRAAGALGTAVTIGLLILAILLAIVLGTVLSLLRCFFRRACALEELVVIESIRYGFNVIRRRLKDVAIMWLIMVGVGLGVGIAMIVVILLLMVAGALGGGLPALLVAGMTSQAMEGVTPWVLAAAVGIPIFLLVVGVPTLFLGGLIEVFKSSVWTLVYRELHTPEGMQAEPGVS